MKKSTEDIIITIMGIAVFAVMVAMVFYVEVVWKP